MCSVPELGLAEQQAEEYADRALSDYAVPRLRHKHRPAPLITNFRLWRF